MELISYLFPSPIFSDTTPVENLIKIGFQQIERELPAVFFSFKGGGTVSAGAIKRQSRQNFDDFLIYSIS